MFVAYNNYCLIKLIGVFHDGCQIIVRIQILNYVLVTRKHRDENDKIQIGFSILQFC